MADLLGGPISDTDADFTTHQHTHTSTVPSLVGQGTHATNSMPTTTMASTSIANAANTAAGSSTQPGPALSSSTAPVHGQGTRTPQPHTQQGTTSAYATVPVSSYPSLPHTAPVALSVPPLSSSPSIGHTRLLPPCHAYQTAPSPSPSPPLSAPHLPPTSSSAASSIHLQASPHTQAHTQTIPPLHTSVYLLPPESSEDKTDDPEAVTDRARQRRERNRDRDRDREGIDRSRDTEHLLAGLYDRDQQSAYMQQESFSDSEVPLRMSALMGERGEGGRGTERGGRGGAVGLGGGIGGVGGREREALGGRTKRIRFRRGKRPFRHIRCVCV